MTRVRRSFDAITRCLLVIALCTLLIAYCLLLIAHLSLTQILMYSITQFLPSTPWLFLLFPWLFSLALLNSIHKTLLDFVEDDRADDEDEDDKNAAPKDI